MNIVVLIILLIFIFVFLRVVFKSVVLSRNAILVFVGGVGAGKTYLAVHNAVKRYKRQRLLYKLKLSKYPPVLISNIPIRICYKRKESYMSCKLSKDMLIGSVQLPRKAIVVIDEFSTIADQWDFKGGPDIDKFDHIMKWFRQLTKGGKMYITDQSFKSLPLQVKRRANLVYNLFNFRRWLGIFSFAKVDVMPMLDAGDELRATDIIAIDNFRYFFVYLPYSWQSKRFHYDTYAYSDLYNHRPIVQLEQWPPDTLKVQRKDLFTLK